MIYFDLTYDCAMDFFRFSGVEFSHSLLKGSVRTLRTLHKIVDLHLYCYEFYC